MTLPLRRDALARRATKDHEEELEVSDAETPDERAELSLELSEIAREAAESLGAEWVTNPPDDLREKAHLYARPLSLLRKR